MGPLCLIFCILKSTLKIKAINFKDLKDLIFLKRNSEHSDHGLN